VQGPARGSAWSAIALIAIAVAAVAAFIVLQVIAQAPPGYGVRPLGGRPRVLGSQAGELAAARRVRGRS
jgi:hypothetical protein